MRPWPAAALVLMLGCDSSGTGVAVDAGDAGADATTGPDGGVSLGYDGPVDVVPDSGGPGCVDIDAHAAFASNDCVYAGTCPLPCATGSASAYACAAGPDASATYPAAFLPPADVIDIIAFEPTAYPWDAAAYVTCASLACTRWATGDHVAGGSSWPSDPCADGGDATQAWTCPTLPGVAPASSACLSAGVVQRIGGNGTGIAVNAVWCCPPPPVPEAGATEAGLDAGADAGDAATE